MQPAGYDEILYKTDNKRSEQAYTGQPFSTGATKCRERSLANRVIVVLREHEVRDVEFDRDVPVARQLAKDPDIVRRARLTLRLALFA